MDQNSEPEWKTRKERIDKRLTALPQPWEIIRYKDELDTTYLAAHAVAEYPTENGPAEYALQHEKEYGRFPKILIFADNDLDHISHADELVKICREEFGQGDEFVQKITGKPNVDRPLQKIRMFRNRPNPKVVVTVDMLTTGVDISALEFIIFLRQESNSMGANAWAWYTKMQRNK